MSRYLHNTSAILNSAILAVFACTHAGAAGVEWLPNYSISGFYNDNYLLSLSPNEVDVSGAEARVGLQVQSVTPVSLLRFTSHVDGDYLQDHSELQTFGYGAGFEGNHRGQRSYLALDAGFTRAGVVTSEIANAAQGTPSLGSSSTTDTGQVFGRNYRNQFDATPEFRFDLSQRWLAEVTANYLNVNYSQTIVGDQVDFVRIQARAGVGYKWSQTSTLKLEVLGADFDPDFGVGSGKYSGGLLRFTHQTSPQSEFYAQAGLIRTRPDGIGQSGKDNWVGGIGAEHQFLASRLYVDLTRSVDGNPAGFMVRRDELRFTFSHSISERVAPYLSLTGIRDRLAVEQQLQTYTDRDYAQAAVGVTWKLTREYALEPQYVRSWSSFENLPDDADANSVRLTFSYTPLSRTSR